MEPTILSILLGIGGMFGWGIYDFLGGVFAKQIGNYTDCFCLIDSDDNIGNYFLKRKSFTTSRIGYCDSNCWNSIHWVLT